MIEPRLWTPPLRELTPETSYGFELNEFAESIDEPFDPWQCWLSIHVGELLPDGRPRFRTVLILVARQSGKTRWAKVWALWSLFVDMVGRYERPTLLGISSTVDYARETWDMACVTAQTHPMLAGELPPKNAVRSGSGTQTLTTAHGTRYKIAAANEDAGRSLTVCRLFIDELRRQKNFTAWAAAEPTTTAVDDAQIICASNQGDDSAVVLDSLRLPAIEFISTGRGDPRLGLFEWSAPDGSDPTDVQAILQANPNVGYRFSLENILGRALKAKSAGGKELTDFKTEQLCMRVPVLDPAIDPGGWKRCLDVGDLEELKDRLVFCVDLAPDNLHATLVAAAKMQDGRVRAEVVDAWVGPGASRELRHALPGLVAKHRPKMVGWFPAGPAAAVAADLADRRRKGQLQAAWPPAGVRIEEIRQEVPAVCMGLAEMVQSEEVAQSGDPLLDSHVLGAERLHIGDAWRFTRKGSGHCDGAYALAGAVHLARTMPTPIGKPRIITAS